MDKREFDAVVVGSGPNGLAAAVTLQREGLNVLLLEAGDTIGGGLRSQELTLPGYVHDVCSAIHPMAAGSPFFRTLPLEAHGLEFVHPPLPAAHPFDEGNAAVLDRSLHETAHSLGQDGTSYLKALEPLLKDWPGMAANVLGPLSIPRRPFSMARFGMKALTSALFFSKRFQTEKAKGLWAGMAAHSLLPLSNLTTSAIALVLMAMGHLHGWPVPRGGAGRIADALASYFRSLGGTIETGFHVKSLDQLPSSRAVLLDVTPKQLLQIAGHRFSSLYKWQLERYRYGMGVFKIDWALDEPVPFTDPACRKAGTVHLGGSLAEIARSEQLSWEGKYPDQPFVLLGQQSLFDPSRAPEGKQTVWAYCHVPNGSQADRTGAIEGQVERFAPGFRERILARHVMNTSQLEAYNANYIGGDIIGGAIDIRQLFTRPALRRSPYRTSAKGIYICSSATPPGGGVHGMCGYYAAKKALKDVFKIRILAV